MPIKNCPKSIFVLFLNFSVFFGQSFERETYQLIRVWNPTFTVLRELHNAGIPLDHVYTESAQYIELVARKDRVAAMASRSVTFNVIIEDMDTWTMARNQPAAQREFPLGSMLGNYTFDEAVARMDTFALNYPNIVSAKMSIGQTIEGREIWAFKVSDNPDSNETEPEVLFTGLTHAREPLSMMNLFYYVQQLCENYGIDEETTFLVNQRQMWFIPILNPDGYVWNEGYYNQYEAPGYHRKNRRDTGCADRNTGVDLNRNFEYEWGADNIGSSSYPCSDSYRGSEAFSEPETSHLRDFVLERNFQNILHYHAFGNVLIHSFGNGNPPPEPDYTMITEIGEWMATENKYSVGMGTYTVNGDAVDWSYGTLGLLSYTPEIGDVFWPSEDRILPLCRDQLYQNKVFSLVAGSDPAITEIEQPSMAVGAGGLASFVFSVQNRGLLPSNGEINIRISPLNDFVAKSAVHDTVINLASRATQSIRVDCNLAFDAAAGAETGFGITVNDSLSLPHTETVVFNVGPPTALPGDIVTDLAQNIFDVQTLVDLIDNGMETSYFTAFIADVNGDGVFSGDDVTDIINIIMEYE